MAGPAQLKHVAFFLSRTEHGAARAAGASRSCACRAGIGNLLLLVGSRASSDGSTRATRGCRGSRSADAGTAGCASIDGRRRTRGGLKNMQRISFHARTEINMITLSIAWVRVDRPSKQSPASRITKTHESNFSPQGVRTKVVLNRITYHFHG